MNGIKGDHEERGVFCQKVLFHILLKLNIMYICIFFKMQEGRTGLESLRNIWRTEKNVYLRVKSNNTHEYKC